jgi:hypothetical protein
MELTSTLYMKRALHSALSRPLKCVAEVALQESSAEQKCQKIFTMYLRLIYILNLQVESKFECCN